MGRVIGLFFWEDYDAFRERQMERAWEDQLEREQAEATRLAEERYGDRDVRLPLVPRAGQS